MGRPPQRNLRSCLLAVLLIGSLAWSGESGVSWLMLHTTMGKPLYGMDWYTKLCAFRCQRQKLSAFLCLPAFV